MAECPKCATALPDDFGMVTCASCGAMVFLDMDGFAHISGDEPAENDSVENDLVDDFDSWTSPPLEETPTEDEEPEEEPQPEEAPPDESPPEELQPTESKFEALAEEPPDEDLSDIAEFGNSEMSQGREGVIYYDLVIEGIDTKNLRHEVKEALEDIRFNWDIGQVLGAIRDGVLKIERLSPPKAVLIVKSLRSLPLEFRWEQRLLSHNEISAETPSGYGQAHEQALGEEGVSEDEEDYF